MEGPDPRPGTSSDAETEHRMPGWVRAFVAVGVLVGVLVVVGLFLGRGDHGPSRHLPGGGDDQVESTEGGGHRSPVEHP